MMKSSDSMDHPLMELISTHLGEDWRMVVRDLGFSNAQLDQFQEDNIFKGVKEVGFHLYHIFFYFCLFFLRNLLSFFIRSYHHFCKWFFYHISDNLPVFIRLVSK